MEASRRYRTYVRESRGFTVVLVSSVVVIGGGVIGCAIAERLSRDRHQVTLLERDQLAAHASGAAAGELSPHSTTSHAHETSLQSLGLFPELVARIEKDSGIDVEYHTQQGLQVAFSKEESAALPSPMNGQEARRLEPALSSELDGAVLLDHAHLTPHRFVHALARSAAAHGAEIHEGTPAIGFEMTGGRIERVMTPSSALDADWVVVAAGPWTREVAWRAGVQVDVRPQRGQLAALEARSLTLTRSIFWSGGYLVPKADGTIIAGGTEEDAGFDDRPTVAGIASLLAFACRLVPGLGAATLLRTWAGLRPLTSSGEPIVGALDVPNLVVATGHHRKGILLAPLAATQVAAIVGKG